MTLIDTSFRILWSLLIMKKAILFATVALFAASASYVSAATETLEHKLEKAIEGKQGAAAVDAAMLVSYEAAKGEAVICITKLANGDFMRRHTDKSKDGTPETLNGKILATDTESLRVVNSFFESSYDGTYSFGGKKYLAPLKNIDGGEEGSTTVCVPRTLAPVEAPAPAPASSSTASGTASSGKH
jgi:hypothetical protein